MNAPGLAGDPCGTFRPAETQPRTSTGSAPRWFGRQNRVLYVLAVTWVLNFLDLGYTITEANARLFREMNPLAAQMMDSPVTLIIFKGSLVWIGSWVLLRYRHRRIAEMACWLILAAYAYVNVRWQQYYDDVLVTLNDPCVTFESQASCTLPGGRIPAVMPHDGSFRQFLPGENGPRPAHP
ncbi:MAG: hypothetical protein HZB38_05460 [Planctomycetes bacterium]|nr:hypothetical protein [Planctomycetota bacterium]